MENTKVGGIGIRLRLKPIALGIDKKSNPKNMPSVILKEWMFHTCQFVGKQSWANQSVWETKEHHRKVKQKK